MAISLDRDDSTIVIGGGIAGLSAACRLAELGQEALLLEAGEFPAHRVCGEFLSPECLPWLERWEIAPAARIRRARFCALRRRCEFALPRAAGSLSRYVLDAALAERAELLGAQVATQTRVAGYRRMADRFEVELADGQVLVAGRLLLGTGRLARRRPALPYVGYKAHFAGVEMGDLLEMHSFPDAYMGIASIGEGTVNVACLTRRGMALPPLPAVLEGGRNLFGWMRTAAPAFGRRRLRAECGVYPIGDAAGAIPPACGDGLAMGITSGVMAAEHAHASAWADYGGAWRRRYGARLRWGRLLHAAMLSPHVMAGAAIVARLFPAIPRWFFELTREPFDRFPSDPPAPKSSPPSLRAADL